MRKILAILLLVVGHTTADAAALRKVAQPRPGARAAADFVSPPAYNIMYPAMNDAMRTTLNPGTTPVFQGNSVSTLTRTNNTNNTRRVVARSGARSAAPTTGGTGSISVSRAGQPGTTQQSRNVVARRSAVPTARGSGAAVIQTNAALTESISAPRCMADYTACMNDYCERPNASYNRCYCSPRLAQIDAEYREDIDELLLRLAAIGGANAYTAAQMNEYWDQIIGTYTGDNSWLNLDDALDINWSDMDSRVRGQNAFVTGHDYCVQHLRACQYMSSNLRDAYRSEIARDCATYETSLDRIRNAATSILEAYEDE